MKLDQLHKKYYLCNSIFKKLSMIYTEMMLTVQTTNYKKFKVKNQMISIDA